MASWKDRQDSQTGLSMHPVVDCNVFNAIIIFNYVAAVCTILFKATGYLSTFLSSQQRSGQSNEFCLNDHHKSLVKKLATPEIEPATSLFHALYAIYSAKRAGSAFTNPSLKRSQSYSLDFSIFRCI